MGGQENPNDLTFFLFGSSCFQSRVGWSHGDKGRRENVFGYGYVT